MENVNHELATSSSPYRLMFCHLFIISSQIQQAAEDDKTSTYQR
jgi:hypothetical protein